MARTSAAAVKLVLGDASTHADGAGDYDGTRDLTPFIDAASAIVDRVVTCATAKGITLSASVLELIERWLAAHAYCLSDQTFASKSTAGASASFHGQTGMHLESTRYGQMAAALDYSGCLNSIGNRRSAGGFWLGLPPSGQTDYADRD